MLEKFKKWLRWISLVGLAVLLIEYPNVQAHYFSTLHSDRLDELVPKLGDALLIAWLISLIVDIGSKKELLAAILFDSSAHIIGRQLPEEIREQVREYLNAKFIRPLWKISYELERHEQTGAVELKSSYWGDLENLTSKRRNFTFSVTIDPSWLANAPAPQLLTVEVRKDKKNILKTKPNGLSLKEKVKIKPGKTGRCETLLECIEYLPDSYEYSLINEATVQRTELTIHWNKHEFDVEVALSSGNDGKVEPTHFETYSIWMIEKPLLPGQCVLTKWKPKATSTKFVEKPIANEAEISQ